MVTQIYEVAQFNLTILLLVGMGLYLVESWSWWRACYRFIHDVFSWNNPMPANVDRGIVYGQNSQRKWTVAGLCSLILFVLMIWESKVTVSHLLAEVIVLVLGVFTTLGGMWLGYKFAQKILPHSAEWFARADKLSEQLDHANVGDLAKKATNAGGDLLAGAISKLRESVKTEPQPPPPHVPVPPPAPPKDPRAELKRLLGDN